MSRRLFDTQQHRAYRAEDTVRDVATVATTSDGESIVTRLPRAAWVLAPFEDWRFVGVPNTAQRLRVIARCRMLADQVVGSPWWKAVGGPREVTLKVADRYARSSRGGRYGHGYGIVLAGTPGHCSGLVIAHELAHVLDHARHGSLVEGHGPTWAGTYLGLTELILGREARTDLAHAFACHQVDCAEGHLIFGEKILAETEPLLPRLASFRRWDWVAPRSQPVMALPPLGIAAKPVEAGVVEQQSLFG